MTDAAVVSGPVIVNDVVKSPPGIPSPETWGQSMPVGLAVEQVATLVGNPAVAAAEGHRVCAGRERAVSEPDEARVQGIERHGPGAHAPGLAGDDDVRGRQGLGNRADHSTRRSVDGCCPASSRQRAMLR